MTRTGLPPVGAKSTVPAEKLSNMLKLSSPPRAERQTVNGMMPSLYSCYTVES